MHRSPSHRRCNCNLDGSGARRIHTACRAALPARYGRRGRAALRRRPPRVLEGPAGTAAQTSAAGATAATAAAASFAVAASAAAARAAAAATAAVFATAKAATATAAVTGPAAPARAWPDRRRGATPRAAQPQAQRAAGPPVGASCGDTNGSRAGAVAPRVGTTGCCSRCTGVGGTPVPPPATPPRSPWPPNCNCGRVRTVRVACHVTVRRLTAFCPRCGANSRAGSEGGVDSGGPCRAGLQARQAGSWRRRQHTPL